MSSKQRKTASAAAARQPQTENAFTAGRELADNFFQQAEAFSPKLVDEVMALRRDYLRAWSDGVGSWLDFSEEVLQKLNVQPQVSSDLKNMARDLTESWIKTEQEVVHNALGVSRSFIQASAAASQAVRSAGYRATLSAVDLVRARETAPPKAARAAGRA